MASNFPISLDTFSTKVDGIDDVLAADTNNLQDAVSALQAKVGVNGSSVSTSIDRRVQLVEAFGSSVSQIVGVNQTWQSVSRNVSTWYQNTTGRAIQVACTFRGRNGRCLVGVSPASYVQVSGNTSSLSDDTNSRPVHSFLVPANHYYYMDSADINNVKELR